MSLVLEKRSGSTDRELIPGEVGDFPGEMLIVLGPEEKFVTLAID